MKSIFTNQNNNYFFNDITNNKEFYQILIKNTYYCRKLNDLYNIALSCFQIENVPKELNENYIKRLLIDNGTIAFTKKSSVGLICKPYNVLAKDECEQPTQINLVCDSSLLTDRTLKSDDFAIVDLSPTKQSLTNVIENTALYETLANQCIFNNIVGKSLQYILQGTAEQREAFNEILDKIFNTLGFIAVDVAKGDSNFLKAQTNELEYIGDKMIELKKHYNNEFLYTLGINHIDYEKKERLITDEVKSNDIVVDLIRNSYIETINQGLKICNDKFKTDMHAIFTLSQEGVIFYDTKE